jgi:hypothetical protein
MINEEEERKMIKGEKEGNGSVNPEEEFKEENQL